MAAFLLVDADRNFRRTIEVALRLEGADVTSVASVADARSALTRRSFDLVTVDTLLPDAEALLAVASAAGLLVLAVGPHPELLARASRRHVVPTLEKPFGPAELLAVARARLATAAA